MVAKRYQQGPDPVATIFLPGNLGPLALLPLALRLGLPLA